MRFKLSNFKEQVVELSGKGNAVKEPVREFIGNDGLCAVDVIDIGYLLEDAELIEDADGVFDLEIIQLNELVSGLQEAA